MSSSALIPQCNNYLKYVASPEKAALDIIAVHSVFSHNPDFGSDNWTTSSGVNWLRDLLPEILPFARIMEYRYDASALFYLFTANKIRDQARDLLRCISIERVARNTHPILFIAYSMGGVLVKHALAIASTLPSENAEKTLSLATMTHGVVFFGTPHRSSGDLSWSSIVRELIKAEKESGTEDQGHQEYETLELERFHESLQKEYGPLLSGYQYRSFVANPKDWCKRLSEYGIDPTAAVLFTPGRKEFVGILDHRQQDMCRLERNDRDWNRVARFLKRAACGALKLQNYTPILERRARTGQESIEAGRI